MLPSKVSFNHSKQNIKKSYLGSKDSALETMKDGSLTKSLNHAELSPMEAVTETQTTFSQETNVKISVWWIIMLVKKCATLILMLDHVVVRSQGGAMTRKLASASPFNTGDARETKTDS